MRYILFFCLTNYVSEYQKRSIIMIVNAFISLSLFQRIQKDVRRTYMYISTLELRRSHSMTFSLYKENLFYIRI